MSGLFRKEVVEGQLSDMGVPLRITSGWMTVFTLLFLVFCLAMVSMLYFGSYSRKATVDGFLLPDKGVVQISSPRSGRILHIHVEEGQEVEAGSLLFTVDVSAESVSGDTIAASFENLVARKAIVEEEISLGQDIAQAEKASLRKRIDAKNLEISVSEQEAVTHALNVDALVAVRKRKEDLRQQELATSDEVALAHKEVMEAKIEASALERTLVRLRNELSVLEAELSGFDQKYANSELSLREEVFVLEQQITELQDQKAILIRAPHSGVVTHVASTVGMAVDPNTVITRLLPEDSVLEALLLIPSRDAGFVRTGTEVKLRYDAYPYQKFGTYEAIVKTISQTTVSQEELPFRLVGNQTEPVYVVTATLAEPVIMVSGEERPLQSGSKFKADLVLEERKLWQWLLGPIRSLQSNV